MELSEKVYNKLFSLFEKTKQNINYELELRFSTNKINYQIYKNIFQKLTFSKLNNGKGLKYEMINELDIFLNSNNGNRSRMTISGQDNIKKYWVGQPLDESLFTFIEKEKLDTFDDDIYDLRISLNNEIPKEKIFKKNMDILKSSNNSKYYRFKNRYRIIEENELFYIDLTNVKSGKGTTFRESNTLNNISKYEIEIEINNNNIQDKTLIDQLVKYIYLVLAEIEGNNIILGNNIKEDVIYQYNQLIRFKNNNYHKKNSKSNFIAASPVTIHKENVIKSQEIPNIYNRYAVTLKADGERYFLYITNDGNIYLFNNRFEVISTGLNNIEFKNTLIEGELVETTVKKVFYAYDMLFSKGIDLRNKWLKMMKREENIEEKFLGRIDFLDRFLQDKNTTIIKDYSKNNVIELKKKPYEYSYRNDGSDIFNKISKIWNERKTNPFNVDGIILCPIMEHYPHRGGSWKSLFKWKPVHLNTIDFLVKYVKNEDGLIINSPFIEDVKRLDDIKERKLKMFRTLELYVGGAEKIYNNISKKMIDKIKPILFNPYKIEDVYLDDNNSSKRFIDANEKIYCNYPITNDEEELLDDTIIEFGYDNNAPLGFNWIPYRFRKDKTNLYKSGENIFGNFESVANDIFRSIKNPVTEDMIMTGKIDLSNINVIDQAKSYFSDLSLNNAKREPRLPYQDFHIWYVKYQLLYFTSPKYLHEYSSGMHGRLLDLCSGKGVDINKIKLMDYAEVIGLELDGKSVQFAQNFFKTIPRPKPKTYYIRADTSHLIFPNQACGITESDKIYIKKYIPEKFSFDTVSLMFCFHYFFQTEITLRTIIQNINDNLKIGGYVIGTCFDGEGIYNKLKDEKELIGKKKDGELMWKIEKKYKSKMVFTDKKPNLGKEIDVFVKSIGVVHKEYLVNFKFVDAIMETYGFEKVLRKPFEEFYNELMEGKNVMNLSPEELQKNIEKVKSMSEDEKRFSFLSTSFIYKKIANSSDSLFIKLAELMEKDDKMKAKEAFAVSQDTEEIIEAAELLEEK